MKYLNILDCSVVDGEGFRVVLFVSGCVHHCNGCHNPESWDFNCGKEFTQDTIDKLIKLLDRSYIDGLTISGGDPLSPPNRCEIYNLCNQLKNKLKNKTIWIYTGYNYSEINQESDIKNILSLIDVLVDGPFIQLDRDITLPFRGSKNQKIIYLNKDIK